MALQDQGPAPYAPTKSISMVIDYTRERGVPGGLITLDMLKRIGVEESLTRRTYASLKMLDLIGDDGAPTPTLEKIRVASSDQYQTVLADWLRDAYCPIFQYAEPTDPVERFNDLFRHYEPPGMRNRMVTLFLGLCEKAGLIAEKPPMPRNRKPRTSVSGTSNKPRAARAENTVQDNKGSGQDPPTPLAEEQRVYAKFLMGLAEKQENPSPELLDRIERALGIGGDSP